MKSIENLGLMSQCGKKKKPKKQQPEQKTLNRKSLVHIFLCHFICLPGESVFIKNVLEGECILK